MPYIQTTCYLKKTYLASNLPLCVTLGPRRSWFIHPQFVATNLIWLKLMQIFSNQNKTIFVQSVYLLKSIILIGLNFFAIKAKRYSFSQVFLLRNKSIRLLSSYFKYQNVTIVSIATVQKISEIKVRFFRNP